MADADDRPRTDWHGVSTSVGGMMSFLHFWLVLLFFLGSYYEGWGWVPLWIRQNVSGEYATDWFLFYVFTQIWTTFQRNQTSGLHVFVDQATSFLSISGTVIVLTLWAAGTLHITAEGYPLLRWLLIVNGIELLLLLYGFKLVATARDAQ